MLALPNFDHMTTSTIQFQSRDKIFDDVMSKNYDVITFFKTPLFYEGPE